MSRPIRVAALTVLCTLATAAFAQPADGSSRFFEHMLKKWDANGDGRISLDEYLAAAKSRFQQIDTQNKGGVSAAQIADSPNAHKRIERRAQALVRHLDTAGQGYVSRDEFIAAAKTRFAKLDRNGDGKLTADELAMPHKGQGANDRAQSGERRQFGQQRFDKLDANHDGVVTLNEFVAAADARFKEFDAAGKGRVSAEQIASSPKAQERAARVAERIVKHLDTNGDGVVTQDEFLAAAKQRFARIDKNGDGFIDTSEIGHRHGERDGNP
jgi:Ca2+-binding EF-hand superfamily protein